MKKTIEQLGSRGRVVIPKDIREGENLKQGDFVRMTVERARVGTPDEAKENIQKQGEPKRPADSKRYNVFEG